MAIEMDDDAGLIEKLARSLIECGGGDPNQMIQVGRPTIYGTPQGEAFSVTPSAAEPLWWSYKGAAKLALEMARDQLLHSPSIYTDIKPNGEVRV
jgi:hypothetical protein